MRLCPANPHRRILAAIRLIHTIVWALFAACILLLPLAGWMRRFDWAAAMATLVLSECLILALNRFRCPLTAWAARFTDDRAPNFDIYLPRRLAQFNQAIFGSLFVFNG